MSRLSGSAPIYISIEGLIGSGKSTLKKKILPHLAYALREYGSFAEIDEPVDEWIASGLLEKSYSEPHVYAFPAQVHFFHTRIKQVRKQKEQNPSARFFLSERSPYSDTLFWSLQKERNNVDSSIYSLYDDMWSMWQDLMPADMKQPNLFIYLKPSLQECMHRTQKRNRKEDKDVPESYQRGLLRLHDEHFDCAFVTMPDGTQVPVLVIEDDGNFEADKDKAAEIAGLIIEKIKSL